MQILLHRRFVLRILILLIAGCAFLFPPCRIEQQSKYGFTYPTEQGPVTRYETSTEMKPRFVMAVREWEDQLYRYKATPDGKLIAIGAGVVVVMLLFAMTGTTEI